MYLSLLRLNPRSKRALTESSRPYELHRSLLKAFPDKADGGPGRVLFRLDMNEQTGGISVLIQSEKNRSGQILMVTLNLLQNVNVKNLNRLWLRVRYYGSGCGLIQPNVQNPQGNVKVY